MRKIITACLVDNDPKGTLYAFINNTNCMMYVIPRSNLEYLKEQDDFQKPAFYILVGENEIEKPSAYIGETENFKERVKSHDNKKQFWNKAYVFVSKDSELTKADVQYLEYKAISEAKQAKTYVLDENKQTPKAPNLPLYKKDIANEFFENIKVLISFIGCDIFKVLQINENIKIFYAKGQKYDAKGYYHSDGFTVLKGSIIAKDSVPSYKNKNKRDNIIEENTILENGNLVLKSDINFSSPSSAAIFCLGRNTNGWHKWKDKDGNTLEAIYRDI